MTNGLSGGISGEGLVPRLGYLGASMTRSRWFLLFAAWTVFGAAQALMRTALRGDLAGALTELGLYYLPLAWGWALLTPTLGAWTRAIDARWSSGGARAAAHLPFLVATALVHTWLRRALIQLLGGSLSVSFDVTLLYYADLTITSYLAALWAGRLLHADAALVERERRTLGLRRALLAAQMQYLELQLRPHFLFNTLSTIAELAHEAPKNAARMLQNVVALLESAVTRSGRGPGGGLVSLGEELEAVRPYLAIQRLRFADWLQIDEDASDEARRVPVPQFILQPLIENAVHHGLIRRTARGRIAIRASVSDGRLRLTVADNGVGLNEFEYRESRGLGLSNLRARLDAVYGKGATLELHNERDGGTAAVLELPADHRIADAVTDAATDATTDGATDAGADVTSAVASGVTSGVTSAVTSDASSAVSRWAARRPMLAMATVWTIVAALRVQHSAGYMVFRGRFTTDAMTNAIRYDIAVAALWLLLTPLVFLIARAIPLRRERLALRLGAHLAAGGLLAFWHAALVGILVEGIKVPVWGNVSPEIYAWNVTVYAILLAIAHHRELERWTREQDVAADRLRRDLQEARFRRMMLELRPQVLLDTLRHLVALVTENPSRSEKILADIGDFLRHALDTIHEPEITLRQESETARAYARVLGAASAPGMTFQLSLPIPLMETPVPNGVLRVALDSVLGDRAEATAGADVRLDIIADPAGAGIRVRALSLSPDGHESRRTAVIGAGDSREVVFT